MKASLECGERIVDDTRQAKQTPNNEDKEDDVVIRLVFSRDDIHSFSF